MSNDAKTPVSNEDILAIVEGLGGIDRINKDITYLRTQLFAVTTVDMQQMQKDVPYDADELQTAFLNLRESDRFNKFSDGEFTCKLLCDAIKAATRSIEYSESTRVARKRQEKQLQYDKWAETNPSLAANPLTDLPIRFSKGLIGEELFKKLYAEAQRLAKEQSAALAAAAAIG